VNNLGKICKISVFIVFMMVLNIYAQETSPVTIAKGDKLTIKVLEQGDLNGAYSVSSDGTLEFPLITDRIKADGLTYDELAAQIKKKLEESYFYKATVNVSLFKGEEFGAESANQAGGVVYIYGMVGSPGAIRFPDDEILTVRKAIIRSGGFQNFANKRKVKLVRKSQVTGKSQIIILNMVDIIDKGKIEKDVALRDGDMIVVPEQFFNF